MTTIQERLAIVRELMAQARRSGERLSASELQSALPVLKPSDVTRRTRAGATQQGNIKGGAAPLPPSP